jgi:hypothetical protein
VGVGVGVGGMTGSSVAAQPASPTLILIQRTIQTADFIVISPDDGMNEYSLKLKYYSKIYS